MILYDADFALVRQDADHPVYARMIKSWYKPGGIYSDIRVYCDVLNSYGFTMQGNNSRVPVCVCMSVYLICIDIYVCFIYLYMYVSAYAIQISLVPLPVSQMISPCHVYWPRRRDLRTHTRIILYIYPFLSVSFLSFYYLPSSFLPFRLCHHFIYYIIFATFFFSHQLSLPTQIEATAWAEPEYARSAVPEVSVFYLKGSSD